MKKFFLLVVVVFSLVISVLAQAQDSECKIDISPAVASLTKAQQMIDSSEVDAALKAVAEARNALQLIEAQCSNNAPEDAGNSRTNPAPLGTRHHASYSDYFSGTLQVSEYIDNAEDYVKQANSRNVATPDGGRYVVFRLKFSCEKSPDEMCKFDRVYFSAVGSKGIVYDYGSADRFDVRIRDIGDDQEVFGGTEIDVALAFVVDADDTSLVLFTNYSDFPSYFASH